MAKSKRKVDVGTKKIDIIPGAEIELGDQVIDLDSGYQGTCTGLAQHLYSCPRVNITAPGLDANGEPKKGHWFEMQGIAVTKKSKPLEADNAWNAKTKTKAEADLPGGEEDTSDNAMDNPFVRQVMDDLERTVRSSAQGPLVARLGS